MVTHERADMTSIKNCTHKETFSIESTWKVANTTERHGSRMILETEFSANFHSFFSVIRCHFSKVQPLVLS